MKKRIIFKSIQKYIKQAILRLQFQQLNTIMDETSSISKREQKKFDQLLKIIANNEIEEQDKKTKQKRRKRNLHHNTISIQNKLGIADSKSSDFSSRSKNADSNIHRVDYDLDSKQKVEPQPCGSNITKIQSKSRQRNQSKQPLSYKRKPQSTLEELSKPRRLGLPKIEATEKQIHLQQVLNQKFGIQADKQKINEYLLEYQYKQMQMKLEKQVAFASEKFQSGVQCQILPCEASRQLFDRYRGILSKYKNVVNNRPFSKDHRQFQAQVKRQLGGIKEVK